MTEWGIVSFQGFSAPDENDFKSIFQLENEKLEKLENDRNLLCREKSFNIWQLFKEVDQSQNWKLI